MRLRFGLLSGCADDLEQRRIVRKFPRFQALVEQGQRLAATAATLGATTCHETELPERLGAIVHRRADGGIGDSMAKANVHR